MTGWPESDTNACSAAVTKDAPLRGVRVLDFTTLLPGPLATLLLAEAGAEVLKVERPGGGDEMRHIPPFAEGGTAVRFLLLNAGKRTVALDLKSEPGRRHARELAREADVVVEQFRPGVMTRLGLGYEELTLDNPGLVYCSITGYGQTGPKAGQAGHDLNYAAETGLLSLVTDRAGSPVLPSSTYADIAGGSYPAVMNIALALLHRARTGTGTRLDIAMAENLFPFAYWGVAGGFAGSWPRPDAELLTGSSPRYALYECADHRWLALAALEQRFWDTFCAAIGLAGRWRDDSLNPAATKRAVAERLRSAPIAHWMQQLADGDACCTPVLDLQEAVDDAHTRARGVFAREVSDADGASVPAMHVPIDPSLRASAGHRVAPSMPPQAAS